MVVYPETKILGKRAKQLMNLWPCIGFRENSRVFLVNIAEVGLFNLCN